MSASDNITMSVEELTKIENTLVMIQDAIDSTNQSAEAQKVMAAIVEAQQICAAYLDKKGTETTASANEGYAAAPPTPKAK